jgi:hypothetical protein
MTSFSRAQKRKTVHNFDCFSIVKVQSLLALQPRSFNQL